MPRLMIQFLSDAETGHREVFVDYFSDSDSTAQEHEKEHRSLVDLLLVDGTFQQACRNQVTVNRNIFFEPCVIGGG